MKFSYKFSNLFGTVYKQGNLIYTSDGTTLLSPVGNRITVFDLTNHSSKTLPFENSNNISAIALTPNDDLLLSIDESGRAILVNYRKEVLLSRMTFGQAKVRAIKFDKLGKVFAIGVGRKLQIWKTPPKFMEFAPFKLLKSYTGHFDEITAIDWSSCGKFVLSGSLDSTCRIISLTNPNFRACVLTAHREQIINCFFSKTRNLIYTISADGAVYVWKWKPSKKNADISEIEYSSFSPEGAWRIKHHHYLRPPHKVKIASCNLQKENDLLVVALTNGTFTLYSMPEFSEIHTLSITQYPVESVAINPSGQWLAFASKQLGQLLVWEWQSETYLLKQQGHYYDMNTVAYSPNGQLIATGSDDGKLKIWNSKTGFCFVTFTEHQAPITAAVFSRKGTGHAVFSSSLDGTVRAFDLIRYRNFRTFTPPEPTQLSSLAIDPSGEIVVAGSLDGFEIYVWSVQTSKLLEVLKGHEGPVNGLVFHPTKPILASASWDATVRFWDIFDSYQATEILSHENEVLALAFNPDGKSIATATLNGNLNIWDVENAIQLGIIEGRKDIAGGRTIGSARTAKTSEASKHFTSISYTASGECILAGGRSKYICIYHVRQEILIKKFQISYNFSLDGLLDFLSSRNLTDGGPKELIDDEEVKDYMPGATRGDYSKRRTPPEIRTKAVQFSPTGRAFVAATTEGLLVYSLDETLNFDPFDLDIDVTPETTISVLQLGQYLKALIMAFQLNEEDLLKKVFYSIPPSQIQIVAKAVPSNYLSRVLAFIAKSMVKSPHLEYHLLWVSHLLSFHSHVIETDVNVFITSLRDLQKNISFEYQELSSLCEENKFTLEYFSTLAKYNQVEQSNEEADLEFLLSLDNPFASGPSKKRKERPSIE